MSKSNKLHFLFIIALPLLILSCWGDSTPTSDKTGTFKVGGIVSDKNGAGIEGVTVRITGTNYSSADTTDTMGVFAFDSIKSGDYKVKAQKDSCFFKPGNIEITMANTDIDTLKFTSVDSYIHGKVLDIMTEEGIEGVRVDFGFKKRFSGTIVYIDSFYTDRNGEYEFFDIIKNDYTEIYVNFKTTNSNSWDIQSGNYHLYIAS